MDVAAARLRLLQWRDVGVAVSAAAVVMLLGCARSVGLRLSNNQLSGTLPDSLAALTGLT
jgi:hypothetical protein